MAETIQEWIVALKYQVDEQSARRVEDIARRLRAGQQVTTQEMREFEKGMKGLARTHETSMRQMSQSAQQHGQKFSTVVNQVIHPSLTKITAALGALSTAVGGFKAFEGVVKNLQQVGDLSRDLNVTALSLNALDKSLQNIGANRGTAASLVTTLQDAVQKNRGNLVLLQGMGVTARDNAERVIELSRFVKREAAANRFDIAVQRIAEIGYSVADARRLLALSEEDYRRQQGIRLRWKQDSADDIKTAQKLRNEWGDLMSNMEGVQNAIFVPMMDTITRLITKVNELVKGREGEIRAFFTAITEPIAQWAENKASDMLRYMENLIGDKGAQERAAWVKWWGDVKKGVDGAFDGIVKVANAISTVTSAIVALNDAYQNSPLSKPIFTVPKEEDKKLPWYKRILPSSLRPSEDNSESDAEVARRAQQGPGASTGRLGAARGAVGVTGVIQQQRQQEEEVRATTDNTEEIKKNTQELQEQRRSSRGFFGTGIDWIKNLVGAGGTQGAGEGGPPDISGRGGAGGGGGGGTDVGSGLGGIGPAGRGKSGLPSGPSGGREGGSGGPLTKNYPKGLADAIKTSAKDLGMSAEDLATLISFETGGSFSTDIMGGNDKYGRKGQYKGLIQFSPENQKLYGIHSGMSAGEQMKAVTKYLRDRGFKPGMSGLQAYAAVNAGHVSKTEASDAAHGGTWGTVRDKWEKQMGGHRQKARELLKSGTGDLGSGMEPNQGPGIGPTVEAARQMAAPEAGSGRKKDSVDIALGMIGKHEVRDRQALNQFLRTGGVGMDPATSAWCAAFVSSSLGQAGLKGAGAVASNYLKWGRGLQAGENAQRGDVGVLQGRGAASRVTGALGGHAMILTGKSRMGPSCLEYEVVGGNVGNKVVREWEPASKVILRRATEREGLPNNQTPNIDMLRSGIQIGKPIDTTTGAPPISTPPNIANDNSRSITQTNEYKTTINAEDARGAASIFKGAAENINRLNMSQIKGVIR